MATTLKKVNPLPELSPRFAFYTDARTYICMYACSAAVRSADEKRSDVYARLRLPPTSFFFIPFVDLSLAFSESKRERERE